MSYWMKLMTTNKNQILLDKSIIFKFKYIDKKNIIFNFKT